MKKYMENVKKNVESEKIYVENMTEHVENLKDYHTPNVENMKEYPLPCRLWDFEQFRDRLLYMYRLQDFKKNSELSFSKFLF